ncbi:hypothetical protein AB6D11_18715 [Vibrio splendidus]
MSHSTITTRAVVYSASDAAAVADVNVTNWLRMALSQPDSTPIVFATSRQFDELRVAVALGELAPFHFDFQGERFFVQSKGNLEPYWPVDFMDTQAAQLKCLMKGIDRTQSAHEVAESKMTRLPGSASIHNDILAAKSLTMDGITYDETDPMFSYFAESPEQDIQLKLGSHAFTAAQLEQAIYERDTKTWHLDKGRALTLIV